MERQNSSLFKEENRPFERAEREGEGNCLFEPKWNFLYFREEFNFFKTPLAFHGQGGSALFKKREADDEESLKI